MAEAQAVAERPLKVYGHREDLVIVYGDARMVAVCNVNPPSSRSASSGVALIDCSGDIDVPAPPPRPFISTSVSTPGRAYVMGSVPAGTVRVAVAAGHSAATATDVFGSLFVGYWEPAPTEFGLENVEVTAYDRLGHRIGNPP